MLSLRYKKIISFLVACMLVASMTGCNKDKDSADADPTMNLDGEGTSDSSDPADSSGDGSDALQTPGDLGYNGDGVDFELEGPGTTNFDNVGLNGSNGAAQSVGTPNPSGEFDHQGDSNVPESSGSDYTISSPPPASPTNNLDSTPSVDDNNELDVTTDPNASTQEENHVLPEDNPVQEEQPLPDLQLDNQPVAIEDQSAQPVQPQPDNSQLDRLPEQPALQQMTNHAPEQVPTSDSIPDNIKLPNTGMFLEDD